MASNNQCPCYGITNPLLPCKLFHPKVLPEPYKPPGTKPGWIDTSEQCATGYCGRPVIDEDPCTRKVPQKLIFVLEYFDRESDLIKKYVLTYYHSEKKSEIADIINHRRFLKKHVVDTVHMDVLIPGNVINIYGRQMTVTEYADSCTKQYLEPKQERAFLLVRPHAVQCIGQIYEVLEMNFKILRMRMAWFCEETATEFYSEHDIRERSQFFIELIRHVTSAPVVAFILVGPCAIERLKQLAGDKDPGQAKLKNAMSLRALYGENEIRCAVDVSETPECVCRVIILTYNMLNKG